MNEETGDEAIKIFGRADHWHSEGTSGWAVGIGVVPPHGISDATFYKWRSKYGGMEVSEAKRLKVLGDRER